MQTTGIIRRVDDLGRIVIPKEIRRMLRIEDGTPMEMFIEGNKVIFQKYVAEKYFKQSVNELKNSFYDVESSFDSETAGKIEEHIKELEKILKESEDLKSE